MRLIGCSFIAAALLSLPAAAQTSIIYTIDTVVGGAVYDNLPAANTPLSFPTGLLVDSSGAVWVADSGNQVIRKMDRGSNVLRVVVGGGAISEDATPVRASALRLERPAYLAADAAGNIYFSDSGQNRIHKLTPDGMVVSIAGTGEAGFDGDGGPATLAKLNLPQGLAFDSAGNLYIAEAANCRIRRISPAGTISTFAGRDTCRLSGDGGPAAAAGLQFPTGIAFDSRGNLYIADTVIRRVDAATGVITTIAGVVPTATTPCGFPPFTTDPLPARTACFLSRALLAEPDGNVVFTHEGGLARLNTSAGTMTMLATGWQSRGVVLAPNGRYWFAQSIDGRVVEPATGPNANGSVNSIAGTDAPFDGPGRLAVLGAPRGMGIDALGRIYTADRIRHRIRRYDPATGEVTTIAGNGNNRLADGQAAAAVALNDIQTMTVDARGNIYFDQLAPVWKIDGQTGILTRVAGIEGQTGFSGDGGPARDALIGHVYGLAVDPQGNLFISDNFNFRVRRVDAATGIITTVAGNGTFAVSGDGGPATSASIAPVGLAFDRQGNLLIGTFAPMAPNAIRRLNLQTGIITSVQGRYSENGPLERANLGSGQGIAVDSAGNIFTSGQFFVDQIRASDSLVVRIAGSTEGFFGDRGPARLSRLAVNQGHLVVDSSGNIYVADELNGRVRKLTATQMRPELSVAPVTLFFTQQQGSTVISGQQISITSANGLALNWTAETSTEAGGGWLNISRTSGAAPATLLVTVGSANLGTGTYRGRITITSAGSTNSPQVVEAILTVSGSVVAALELSQQYLTFNALQGGGNPTPQTLSITNSGSGTLSWQAAADTSSGGNWLRVSPALGTAPSSLSVSVDITGLQTGIYQGRVVLRNLTANETRTVSVVLNVSRQQPILLPTQTGFIFTGVEGSLVVGPQNFGVQNAGQGRLNWRISVNVPGGGDWLRVSPLQGASDAGSPTPQVTLQADPSRLRAGIQVALLTITADGALNAPQTAIVLVNMLPRGSPAAGLINPLGLIFTSPAGSTAPVTQTIALASTGGQALQFAARARTQAGGDWLSVSPDAGVLLSSAETVALGVTARPGALAPGVYFGTIALTFGSGITQEVAVALVVTSGATAAASAHRIGAACTPTRAVVIEKKLGNRFALDVGWPVPLLAEVVDDCGASLAAATVTAGFTGTDPPLAFQNLRNGQYAATWVPAAGGTVGITIRAVSSGVEAGVAQLSGTIGNRSSLPLLFRDGWVNAASFDRFKPLAPGMIFSVFGTNLAQGSTQASQVPLPRELGTLKMSMNGVDVPLFYAGEGQVNAQVPFELAGATSASIVASGRGSASVPGTVTMVNAQPGIFTVSQSGSGQGIIVDAQNRVVDANHAVAPGDVVVIYATGLGVTQPPVATGLAAPLDVLSRVVVPPSVTIGGQPAQIDFAGLVPGLVGLYQINVRVPTGITPGNAVPVVVTQNGVDSNSVTIAVR